MRFQHDGGNPVHSILYVVMNCDKLSLTDAMSPQIVPLNHQLKQDLPDIHDSLLTRNEKHSID